LRGHVKFVFFVVHSSPDAASDDRTTGRLLVYAALALTALVYAGTLRFGFVYDDGVQIVLNPAVQSWQNAPQYFTQQVWTNLLGAPPTYYRPLFLLWCLVNFSLFGLKAWGWHWISVMLHLVATALVFRLAQLLTRDGVAAGIAALIFGLHPLHVESVAWISGVPDPLCSIFFIAAFLAWLNWRDGGERRGAWLAASFVCFALALLCKEIAIVLPFVVGVYEWLANHERSLKRTARASVQSAIFLPVMAGYLLARAAALHGLTHPRIPLPWHVVPLTWPSLVWFYIRKLFWPFGLSPFYDRPYVFAPSWSLFWGPILGIVAVAFLIVVVYRAIRRSGDQATESSDFAIIRSPDLPIARLFPFSLVWLVAPLLPTFEILSLEPREIAHDRYLYLPLAGFALLIAIAVRQLHLGEARILRLPALQFGIIAAVAVALGAATSQQMPYWANDILLFYRAVKIAPTSDSATNNLANALLARGYYNQGIGLHEQLLRRNPRYWTSYYNLGNAYYKLHRYDDAEHALFEAAKLQPQNPQLFVFLATVQRENGHPREAEQNLREAIRIWPTGLGAHYMLGALLAQQQRWGEAAVEFRKELALDPEQPKVREELSKAEGEIATRPQAVRVQ